MKVTSVLVAGLVCCILATGYAADVEAAVKAVAKANNYFGKKLLKLLGQGPGNLLISPLSLQNVMAMVLSGAGGQTAIELREVLGLPPSQEEVESGYKNLLLSLKNQTGAQVGIASKLYLDKQYKFDRKFQTIAGRMFSSGAAQVDMKNHSKEAAAIINAWVEQRTNEFIKDFVDADGLSNASLILVNALHFEANWSSPFSSSHVYNQSFLVQKRMKKFVPMMKQELNVSYASYNDFKAIKLNYEGNYSMVILLPNTMDGIKELVDSLPDLDCEHLETKFDETAMEVYLPKFFIESSLKLSEPLKQLGIKTLFSNEAELPGFMKNSTAAVTEVLQKTFIRVDEKGTEIVAAMHPIMGSAAQLDISTPGKFVANHPFVFSIKHEPSGAALLLGRYSGPE